MKKYLAAGAAVLVVAGAGLGARAATQGSSCAKPLTLFDSEQTASIAALESYIEQNIAPGFKSPADLVWESEDFTPTLEPGKIAAGIAVYNPVTGVTKHYHVTLVRECQGGNWKVVEFRPL